MGINTIAVTGTLIENEAYEEKQPVTDKDSDLQQTGLNIELAGGGGGGGRNNRGQQDNKCGQVQEYADNIIKHSTQCGGSIILSGESRDGLVSILTGHCSTCQLHCSTCQHTITLEASKKVKGSQGHRKF